MVALPRHRRAVIRILKEISSRILGKALVADDGRIGYAIEIIPGGDEVPGQEASLYQWTVVMAYNRLTTEQGFLTSLTAFIPVEELQDIFERSFGPNPSKKNPYELKITSLDRYKLSMQVGVRVRGDGKRLVFYFDWGREQDIARRVMSFDKYLSKEDPQFNELVEILGLLKPKVYRGGPDPLYHAFESFWFIDYKEALAAITFVKQGAEIGKYVVGDIVDGKVIYLETQVVFLFGEGEDSSS